MKDEEPEYQSHKWPDLKALKILLSTTITLLHNLKSSEHSFFTFVLLSIFYDLWCKNTKNGKQADHSDAKL